MTFLILSYLGGVITIVSPCILPVLPFVFARAGQPFRKSGLPLLAGMAITFAAVASAATIGGSWAVQANQYGRIASLVLLGLFGLTLIWDSLADRITRPLVRLGGRLSESVGSGGGVTQSFVLGVATGLLWAPCAGPILGLILTGAALQGANTQTSLLLLAYAAGAATSLGLALLAGARVFAVLKRSLGAETWIRRALGIAVLVGVTAIALGADRGILSELSLARTSSVEQWLLDRFHASSPTTVDTAVVTGSVNMTGASTMHGSAAMVAHNDSLLNFSGATTWLNSLPLDATALKGNVVVVDFWTYSCINCLRSLPYVRAWADRYKDQGLVVIGVHTPEFAFEQDLSNVKTALHDLGITYPIVVDNRYAIWQAFDNEYWPAHYFFDAAGRLRYQHFGEGEYAQSEREIQGLLAERNGKVVLHGVAQVNAEGREAAADDDDMQSFETYIGFDKSEHFVSPGGLVKDQPQRYTRPVTLKQNDWGLVGNWAVGAEDAVLTSSPGRIIFRFHARDLHLVLGTNAAGRSIRFRVKLDGAMPGDDHGVDINAQGNGTVVGHRLYQLIRQRHHIRDHVFEIEFFDPGVQAFAFTFG